MFNLTIIDWLLLAILVFSIVSSAIKGFVREAMTLASVVVAVLLSSWFYRPLSGTFKGVVTSENLALFLGFSVIFLGTLVAGLVATWLITRFVKFAKLVWADRLLGAAFGFIRGWVIGAVILLGLTAFEVQTERLHNSQLPQFFLPGARVIAIVTPYELKAKFLVGYRALERWWREH